MQRADRALLLNPDQATAHYTKALLIMYKAKPNDAASANEIIAEAEAALRADPSFAGAYWAMAQGEMVLGRYEQSMSHIEQAMRISPRDSRLGVWHMDMGRDLLALRRTDAAVQEGLKAIDLGSTERSVELCRHGGVRRGGRQGAGGEGFVGRSAAKLNPKLSVAIRN